MMAELLPTIFLLLMGVAVLMYAILDGFDLGIGIILPQNNLQHRNQMIASIGPFWDANETWLVLAVGILLIAFPAAHNIVLRELYLPAVIMLIGLILRGVAFDFRAKAVTRYQSTWDKVFQAGSLTAALSQGFMLGLYVTGFQYSVLTIVFSLLTAIGAAAAYVYIGGAWLVLKTEGELQRYGAKKARQSGWLMALSFIAICIVNPLLNPQVAERWFTLPGALVVFLIPLMCGLIWLIVDQYLRYVPLQEDRACWMPFVGAAFIFTLCLTGFAYSYYPDVIPGQLSADEAASATASLQFVFYGVVIVLPVILAYTLLSYRIFKGKTTELNYY
ncbi:cytochrome d ubiquinol oxidase subunit II [Pleionea litopenaei]|uniref:Cytochrome d ubiquinol oxidase subunit II n=1 Tax=Pleionea litopenaei TaxID=3070815 RepID=A0AA51RW67_9GAMM|nr:cytochrome d ubiquinol oxidase subunit II [Pleionea sp. HL-JVS1]WMS88773.1 cytochrome d ubiquinol oxidase subunit II [Pleionea sp. HL-JVS1]